MKLAITLAMLIDTAHIVVILEPSYTYLVSDFGNFAALEMNSPGRPYDGTRGGE